MNLIQHVNRIKNKHHVIISIEIEKAFQKTQYSFMMKTLKKLGIKVNFLILIKNIYKTLTDSIIFNGGKLRAFPYDQDQDKDVCSLYFQLTV